MATIELTDVPDEVQTIFQRRADGLGISLPDYVVREMQILANQPTFEEMTERIKARGSVNVPITAAQILSAERYGGKRD